MHCSSHLAVSAAVSSALALAACRPVDKQVAGDHAKTEDARMAEGADENTGLATEKQRLGYILGIDIGNSLKPMKDDIAPRNRRCARCIARCRLRTRLRWPAGGSSSVHVVSPE